MNSIHFFDLDDTLWEIDNNIWIIDKNKPELFILKISKNEYSMIKHNFFRKDGFKIEYNGEINYISKELFDKIQKTKIIPIENIGISLIELSNKEYLENSKLKILINNINHLVGKTDKICLLTGRCDRKKHENLLNLLRLKLKEKELEIFKIYFVGKQFKYFSDSKISYDKLIIILEHLIGVKIEDNKFISKKQDSFENVYFYDDLIQNIEMCHDIQNIFDDIFRNTNDDYLKKIILERIEKNNLKLILNLVGSNHLNKFKTNILNIKAPKYFPIKENLKYIKNFNSFLK
jgi:hypothetical protein